MALTTHEKIRVSSGFQSRFVRQAFRNSPNGSFSIFYVDNDDNVKLVPEFGTGNTIAGISDVQVWLGLSGIYGVSRIGVSSIDIDQGAIQLVITPPSGVSLTTSYSSSAITSIDIETVRKEAEAIINQRLALCYSMPISPIPSVLDSMANRLAASFLLIRGYGAGTRRDMAVDGYRLYSILMGDNQMNEANATIKGAGEIGMICTPNWQLVDDSSNIINRNDTGAEANDSFTFGGRIKGRIYDITEENFRRKDWQENIDRNQPESGLYPNQPPIMTP